VHAPLALWHGWILLAGFDSRHAFKRSRGPAASKVASPMPGLSPSHKGPSQADQGSGEHPVVDIRDIRAGCVVTMAQVVIPRLLVPVCQITP